MNQHVSKKDRMETLLSEIKSKTTKENVDLVLPLLEWNLTKIDLITSADKKRQEAKKAKQAGHRPPQPLFVARGEIWEAYLGINVGSEQSESRPVLVIQNEANNKKSPNTIVAPLSDLENRIKRKGSLTEEQFLDGVRSELRPTEVLLPRNCVNKGETQLRYPSILLCQNVRDVSKERLRYKITTIEETYWKSINEAISFSLGLHTP